MRANKKKTSFEKKKEKKKKTFFLYGWMEDLATFFLKALFFIKMVNIRSSIFNSVGDLFEQHEYELNSLLHKSKVMNIYRIPREGMNFWYTEWHIIG